MNFIAFDFETANSARGSACSIGLAIVQNGRIVGTEHIFIKPTPNYYDGINTSIHGINDTHTRDKKNFKQLWSDLKPFFHKQNLVAHNAAFDCSVLRYALDDAKLAYPDLDYHCTLQLSKAAITLPGYRLNEVSQHFDIKLSHHNAESDAKACALIALRLADKHKVSSLQDLSGKFGFKMGQIYGTTKSYRPYSKK